MTIDQLTQSILETHHQYMWTHMPRLDRLLRDAHAPDELMRPWAELVGSMEEHMRMEETVLFPALIALSQGMPEVWVEGPIEAMEMAHEDIRAIERTLRDVAHLAGPLRTELVELLDDLAEHARKEDEDLFPEARARLGQMTGARPSYMQ